jgi:hypothetical protein
MVGKEALGVNQLRDVSEDTHIGEGIISFEFRYQSNLRL